MHFDQNRNMASGLKQRVNTAILIGIPILFLVFYSDFSRSLFLCLMAVLTSWEYLRLLYPNFIKSPIAILSFTTGLLIIAFTYLYPEDLRLYLLVVAMVASLILIYDLYYGKHSIQLKAPWLWNIIYIILPLCCLLSFHESEIFEIIVISVLLMIWISDSGAYFVGKSTGRRKLMPSISPGKTWEGFWGAGLLSLLFSYTFFSYFNHFNVQVWGLIAIFVWFFGSIGDLVESKLKRKLYIKDSGTIMPGHGGFLDRFDGFIFCLPFVLTLIQIFK